MAKKTETKVGLHAVEDISSLAYDLEQVQSKISDLKKQEDETKLKIKNLYASRITDSLKQKDEPFGVVNFEDAGLKVSFTTPKKVEWDQDGLAKLYAEGAPVSVEYNVKEVIYKELNQAGKDAFMPYRTVKPGSVSIKIERQ